MSDFMEAKRRHDEMVREWTEAGHPLAPCSGHHYPGLDCPKPDQHEGYEG